ncbi:MAG: hypothetical protein RLZZ15_1928 [Verrucomicrobiota bacterium]|jgi:hypothetical protein
MPLPAVRAEIRSALAFDAGERGRVERIALRAVAAFAFALAAAFGGGGFFHGGDARALNA